MSVKVNLNNPHLDVEPAYSDVYKYGSIMMKQITWEGDSVDEGAILISGARAEVKCQVIDILHLTGIEAENVLYLQMLSGKENGGDALHIADLPM